MASPRAALLAWGLAACGSRAIPTRSVVMGAPTSVVADALVPRARAGFVCVPQSTQDDPAIRRMAANLTGGGQAVDAYLARYTTPGLSVAYRDAAGVVHAGVFGSANNRATDPDAPALSPTTLFQAGPVSGSVAALAYLMTDLADATLDADIRLALGDRVAVPRAITPAELLTHTAGTTVHSFDGVAPGEALPTVEAMVLGAAPSRSPAVAFETPGEWRFSGGGYALWQAWVERAARTDLATLVRSRLMAPAGATRSGFEQPLPTTEHDAACGYDPARLGGLCRRAHPALAATGLWTTPSELVCMAGYVATRRADVLVRVASRAVVVPSYPQRQGIGLMHRRANGLDEREGRMFEQGGGEAGFCAQWVFFSDGRAIAAMDNGCRGATVRAARALCRELGWTCAGHDLGLR